MKNLKFLLALIVMLSFMFVGCPGGGNDDDDDGGEDDEAMITITKIQYEGLDLVKVHEWNGTGPETQCFPPNSQLGLGGLLEPWDPTSSIATVNADGTASYSIPNPKAVLWEEDEPLISFLGIVLTDGAVVWNTPTKENAQMIKRDDSTAENDGQVIDGPAAGVTYKSWFPYRIPGHGDNVGRTAQDPRFIPEPANDTEQAKKEAKSYFLNPFPGYGQDTKISFKKGIVPKKTGRYILKCVVTAEGLKDFYGADGYVSEGWWKDDVADVTEDWFETARVDGERVPKADKVLKSIKKNSFKWSWSLVKE